MLHNEFTKMRPNRLNFHGNLTKIFPAKQVISKNGKSYIIRQALVEERNENGLLLSSVLFNIPESFDIISVEKMVGLNVTVALKFNVKCSGDNCYMNVWCSKIQPIEKDKRRHTQSYFLDNNGVKHEEVDEDGYSRNYDS